MLSVLQPWAKLRAPSCCERQKSVAANMVRREDFSVAMAGGSARTGASLGSFAGEVRSIGSKRDRCLVRISLPRSWGLATWGRVNCKEYMAPPALVYYQAPRACPRPAGKYGPTLVGPEGL